jgi:hypothetical protein
MTNRKVSARLTYLAASVESSLSRNGKVFTHRDRDGNDGPYHGVLTEERDVTINDARRLDESRRRQLELHGFELLHRPMQHPNLDFFDNRQVLQEYYPECVELVRRATNAACVFAFDHNIRWAAGNDSGKRIAGGQLVQRPIHLVHADYTLASAPRRLRDLARPPGVNDTLRSVLEESESLLTAELVSSALNGIKRFVLINVWRNIDHSPVISDPLALSDGQSVRPDDLVVFEILYHSRIGENYFAKYAPRHEWWYYPFMTREEVVLIKQWDSAGELARSGGACANPSVDNADLPCTFSFHTAFRDPNTSIDAPARQSIEVRCIAFFSEGRMEQRNPVGSASELSQRLAAKKGPAGKDKAT